MSKLRNLYLITISILGVGLLVWGLAELPNHEQPLNLILLIILAAAAQSTATFAATGIHFSVGSALSLATVPLYGPFAAVIVVASSELCLWYISIRSDHPGFTQAISRLGFNVGMNGLSIFVAGSIFMAITNWLGPDTFIGQTLPWLIAAIVGDQLNIWLLIGIIYLTHGIPPLDAWHENRWAMPINVIVMAVGGSLLALAVQQFDYLGLAIFFLPILLSAYSFRLFVSRTQDQMGKLEELVDLRTQDLTDANKRLADLHKEKDAFLAVLTHDMRTPLTSILGYTSLLRDRPALTDDERAHISRVILRNGKSLLEIVNNILEIEQLESGTPIILERENFDLTRLIGNVVESIESQSIEKNIQVQCEFNVKPLFINGDKQKLQRVIINLVSNAIKYTPDHGFVTIEATMNGHDVVVDIKDTGYGIPAEDLPYIFERFRRVTQHKDKAVGTGLGLAIVKSLVEAHEGEITVTSEEGVGSTFTIRLPA